MIGRAVESVERFIKEEQIKTKVDSLRGNHKTLKELMDQTTDDDFATINVNRVGEVLNDCNDLLSFFERIFDESIKASNSAQAVVVYGHIVDTIQLKNQTLAWADKTLPHGTSRLAKEGVLELLDLLEDLLPAVR
jgi:hypothetical protein